MPPAPAPSHHLLLSLDQIKEEDVVMQLPPLLLVASSSVPHKVALVL